MRIFAFLESLLLKGREYKQCFHVKVTNFVQRCFYDGYDCFMLSAFFFVFLFRAVRGLVEHGSENGSQPQRQDGGGVWRCHGSSFRNHTHLLPVCLLGR